MGHFFLAIAIGVAAAIALGVVYWKLLLLLQPLLDSVRSSINSPFRNRGAIRPYERPNLLASEGLVLIRYRWRLVGKQPSGESFEVMSGIVEAPSHPARP